MPKHCSIDGCERPFYARGWCTMHYWRWYRNDDPEVWRANHKNQGKSCSIDGCDKPAKSRGWCGVHYKRWHEHGDPLVVHAPERLNACAVCGNLLSARQRRFCSKRCANRLHWREAEAKAHRPRTRKPRPRHQCICVVCSALFEATEARARYCSTGANSCEATAKSRPSITVIHVSWCRTCRTPIKGRGRAYCSRECLPSKTAPPFDCTVCGAHVVPGTAGHHCQAHRYCGAKCRDRAARERARESLQLAEHRQRRRARKRKAYVAPVYRKRIFERDDWKCQICGEAVRRKVQVPHPLAPTIDHIIPLADGGTHEPANVQTAHFLCNARKCDRAGLGGDQLRLAISTE